jgi:release factor glutamine methyltransferase
MPGSKQLFLLHLRMDLAAANTSLAQDLSSIYGQREAILMSEMVMEKLTGFRSSERSFDEDTILTAMQQLQLQQWKQELLQHRPIQYVLQESWFQDLPFYVDENVLIPRPETEELVEWIIRDEMNKKAAISILDIGSGSGCIPVSLAKKLPHAKVFSCDVSEPALNVAKKNAAAFDATIHWIHADFLLQSNWNSLPIADIIVSNPPYIPQSGRFLMEQHVTDFEPDIALFVPDNNALIFYETIALFARDHAKPGARIYVEIHEEMAAEVSRCFEEFGLHQTEIKKDMQGKDRMVKAVKRS